MSHRGRPRAAASNYAEIESPDVTEDDDFADFATQMPDASQMAYSQYSPRATRSRRDELADGDDQPDGATDEEEDESDEAVNKPGRTKPAKRKREPTRTIASTRAKRTQYSSPNGNAKLNKRSAEYEEESEDEENNYLEEDNDSEDDDVEGLFDDREDFMEEDEDDDDEAYEIKKSSKKPSKSPGKQNQRTEESRRSPQKKPARSDNLSPKSATPARAAKAVKTPQKPSTPRAPRRLFYLYEDLIVMHIVDDCMKRGWDITTGNIQKVLNTNKYSAIHAASSMLYRFKHFLHVFFTDPSNFKFPNKHPPNVERITTGELVEGLSHVPRYTKDMEMRQIQLPKLSSFMSGKAVPQKPAPEKVAAAPEPSPPPSDSNNKNNQLKKINQKKRDGELRPEEEVQEPTQLSTQEEPDASQAAPEAEAEPEAEYQLKAHVPSNEVYEEAGEIAEPEPEPDAEPEPEPAPQPQPEEEEDPDDFFSSAGLRPPAPSKSHSEAARERLDVGQASEERIRAAARRIASKPGFVHPRLERHLERIENMFQSIMNDYHVDRAVVLHAFMQCTGDEHMMRIFLEKYPNHETFGVRTWRMEDDEILRNDPRLRTLSNFTEAEVAQRRAFLKGAEFQWQ